MSSRPVLPSSHGELTTSPQFGDWKDLVAANRSAAAGWSFDVGGLPVGELRALARREALAVGDGFSAKLGVDVRASGDPLGPIVATGHQPDIIHPGVWAKYFLLERLALQLGASAYDVVVDSDGFDSVALTAPCTEPAVGRCRVELSHGSSGGCYASVAVPSTTDVDKFCRASADMLSTLPAPSVQSNFAAFCDELQAARSEADNLAQLMTISRRRFEARASTGYLEAPMTLIAHTTAFRRFVVHVALDATKFVQAYNEQLRAYRDRTKTRSAAQPVPDLAFRDDDRALELPFWSLQTGIRSPLWVAPGPAGAATLSSDDGFRLDLPADPALAAAALAESDVLVVPKALALTLFVRMFACDLFIHGTGGGRYDQVTDGVMKQYFGIEPPRFVVASLTMQLPLGGERVDDAEIAAAKDQLHRLEHNPDSLLAEIEFDSDDERSSAGSLAAEKRELVAAIKAPGADKKSIGLRIRDVNEQLGVVLAPLRERYAANLARLERQFAESDVLEDRTYPFCYWDPSEIARAVRAAL